MTEIIVNGGNATNNQILTMAIWLCINWPDEEDIAELDRIATKRFLENASK